MTYDPNETITIVPGMYRSDELTQPMHLWEEAVPQEPLEAKWLHHVTWAVPAALTVAVAGLGAWSGPVTVVRTGYHGELIRWWDVVVGGSAVGLRAPAMVAMAAAAAIIALAGTRAGGRRVGLLAGLVFAVLPTTSQWARDTGPVALMVLLSAAAALLGMTLIDRPTAPAAVGYAVATGLLGMLGGVTGWLVLAAHLTGVLASGRNRRTALCFGPAALVGAAAAAVPLLLGPAEPPAERLSAAVQSLPGQLFGGLVVAGAVLSLAFLGASMRRLPGFVTWCALVPIGGLIVAAAVVPVWSPERLMVTVPALVVLASVAMRRFTFARGVCALLVIALLGVPAQLDLLQATPEVPVNQP